MYVIFGNTAAGVMMASGTSIFISYTCSGMFSTAISSSTSPVSKTSSELVALDSLFISVQFCPHIGHFFSLIVQYSKLYCCENQNDSKNNFLTVYYFPRNI